MNRILGLIMIFLFVGSSVSAQDYSDRKKDFKERKGITYDTEMGLALRGHTNGWAIAGNYGKIKTYYQTNVIQFEIAEIRHPKEIRQSFDFFNTPLSNSAKSFVFGKQNNLYAARLGYGGKRYFSEKADQRGVAVGITYSIGPSLGFVKPYYLQLRRFEQNSVRFQVVDEKYTEENAGEFLNINSIFGGSGFAEGLNEVSIVPGGHAKFGVHLDWGAFDEFIKALEAGIMVDIYSKEIPLMILEDNSPFFLNFYVNIELGKRQ